MYITTITINNHKINILKTNEGYLFEREDYRPLTKEQIAFLTDLFKPKEYLSSWQQKLILTMCFCTTLNTNPILEEPPKVEIVSEFFTERNIKNVINQYHLTKSDYILENQENFWAYYNAVMENKFFQEEDRRACLQNFYHVNKYLGYDFENQLKKIRNRKIFIDDELCNSRGASGTFQPETDNIFLKTNASNSTRVHENVHHHWDYKGMHFLTDPNLGENSPLLLISAGGFPEALASDLACEEASNDGFTENYRNLNLCLQGFYTIFTRDEMLKILSQPNYLELLSQELVSILGSVQEVSLFLARYHTLTGISVSSISMEDIDYDILLMQLSNDLIHIYERKTNQKWTDNLKMKSIIYALNEEVKLDSFPENIASISHFQEIKDLKEKKDFLKDYGIDLNMAHMSVNIESENVNWNGDLCIKLNKGILENTDIDTYLYAFEGNELVKQDSYNSLKHDIKKELEFIGIPEIELSNYLEHSSFYSTYSYLINNTDYLNKEEKRFFLLKFPDFLSLHSRLFEQNNNNTMVFDLFCMAYGNCSSKEQIIELFCDEDILYQKGGKRYLEMLEEDGFIDKDTQKDMVINIRSYEAYKMAIKYFQNIGYLNEEEVQKLKWEYNDYRKRQPKLFSMYPKQVYMYFLEEWKDCRNFEDFMMKIQKEPEIELDDMEMSWKKEIPNRKKKII